MEIAADDPICAPCSVGDGELERFLKDHGVETILDTCLAANVRTVEALAALARQEDQWDEFTEEAGMSRKVTKKLMAALEETAGQAQNTVFLDDDERQEVLDYWGESWELPRVLKRMNGLAGSQRAKVITELYNRCAEASKLKDEPTHLQALSVKGQGTPLPLRWYPGLPRENYDPAKKYYTLLVLGETGVGKTTLLDAFANYLAGINYHDLWRYKLVNENHFADKMGSQSQTTEITYYLITDERVGIPEAERCHVKIIDSPGFGDTGGMEADRAIAEKFRELFTEELEELDYILAVVKATESRWTSRAKYVYDNVQQLFGTDASQRFVLMCTFADGGECLAATTMMPEMACLCDQYFTFNNSALYTPKRLGNPSTLMFWNMCMTSVKNFIKFVKDEAKPPMSLCQAKEVILTRDYLKASMATTRNHIKSCMDGLEYLHRVLDDIAKNEDKINMNGTYTLPPQMVTKLRWVKRDDAKPTQFCKTCQVPCCQVCAWPLGFDESQCTYFNSDPACPKCPGKCPKSAHKRWEEVDYQEKYEVEEKGVDIHKKNLFEQGKQQKSFAETLLAEKVAQSEALAKQLLQAMQSVKESQAKLEEIALKPKVFTDLQYFVQMIKTETNEKKAGWQKRVQNLEAMRDEVQSMQQYESVDNLQDLFPQYQAVIGATIRKAPGSGRTAATPSGRMQLANCVIS